MLGGCFFIEVALVFLNAEIIELIKIKGAIMSKTKKKKHRSKKKRTININNPRSFFKSIGIKPLVKKDKEGEDHFITKELFKLYGPEKAKAFIDLLNERNSEFTFDFCHSNLELAKIWYGVDFNRTCLIADELKELSLPSISNVLDLGGGAGHIAFFMAKLWPDCNITVADKFSDIGRQWAKEIGEDRVCFTDALLPDLESLENHRFDLIVMSRVLGNMEELNLPSRASSIDTESYFNSQAGQHLFEELEKIAGAINRHLTEKGFLVVIDSWSDFRVLIIGRAFEKRDLHITLEHFHPEKVAIKYSTIVFSKIKDSSPISDIPHGLSNMRNLCDLGVGNMFGGIMAESLRAVFNDAVVVKKSDLIKDKNSILHQGEVLEKEGFSLMYYTDNDGKRLAILDSSIYNQHQIKFLQDLLGKVDSGEIDQILKVE